MLFKTINVFFLFKLFLLMINTLLYSQQQQLLIEDFQVNENAGWCDHYEPHIAMNADGSFIIVWHDFKNTHADVYLQRFDSNLNINGDDILVNDDGGRNNQTKPEVDIDIDGRFVVTWIDERSGKAEIYVQRFDSLANPLSNNFSVNDGNGELTEYSNPSIAVSFNGNFVITWLEKQDNEFGIYAILYKHNGERVTNIFKVNNLNNSVDGYSTPDAGIDENGNFVIVWEDLRQNKHRDIFAQRFDTEGNKLGENFKVNGDNNDRYHGSPSVSVFSNGRFIVSWIDERNYFYDIYAQQFDDNGVPVAGNFMVNDVEDGQQFTPIVCTSLSGRFVITWKDAREAGHSYYDIFSQIYDEHGTPIGSNMKIHDDENSMYYLTPPTSDMDSTGNFIIAWNDRKSGNYQIYAQKFDLQGNHIVSPFQVNTDEGSGHQYNPAICTTDNSYFFIVWEDYRNGNADIYVQSIKPDGFSSGENHKVNETNDNSFQGYPQIGIDSKGKFFIVWEDRRNNAYNIYGQRFNADGQPLGKNFIISNGDNINLRNRFPKLAMNQFGNSIVAWIVSNDFGIDIYARRYNSNGLALGNSFKVNDDDGFIVGLDHLYENEFAIGIDNSNNYVISWTEYRNHQAGISYKVYNSNGIPIKNVDRVNFDDYVHVFDYSMCMGPNGYFVISWVNWKNEGNDNIYAQLYNSFGNPIGNNLLINDVPGSIYRHLPPTLSMDINGDFCIAWQDNRNGNYDIYGQMYSSSGQLIDSNFKINSNQVISDQKDPSIYLKNKKLYTVWEDNRIQRQGWDIFANVISLEKLTSGTNSNFHLFQNYPNPFNHSTKIIYQLPFREHVSIKIYNTIGQLIKTLVNEFKESGIYTVYWNGNDYNNDAVASGLYFCKMLTSNYQKTIKLILIR